MLIYDRHLFQSFEIDIYSKSMVTADYSNLTERAMLIFFAIRGWKIAGMANGYFLLIFVMSLDAYDIK